MKLHWRKLTGDTIWRTGVPKTSYSLLIVETNGIYNPMLYDKEYPETRNPRIQGPDCKNLAEAKAEAEKILLLS